MHTTPSTFEYITPIRLFLPMVITALVACAEPKTSAPTSSSPQVATSTPSAAVQQYQKRERFDQPPLPKSDIAGVDTNENHIRDDIELYIDQTHGHSAREWLAQRQQARAYQHLLVYAQDEKKTMDAIDDVFASNACSGALNDNYSEIRNELKARLVNTEDRLHAYIGAHRHAGGQYFDPPSKSVIQCQFDTEGL